MSICNCKVEFIRPRYKNLKEWCEDENNEYIGRKGIVFIKNEEGIKERYPKNNSIFYNPYKINKDGDRNEVIEKYKIYIINRLKNENDLLKELLKLKNKNLGCWCYPERCHGDILKEIINSTTTH